MRALRSRRDQGDPRATTAARPLPLAVALALAAGAVSGCFLADPRPDPAADGGIQAGSDASGAGPDSGAAASDAALGSALEVASDSVAVSGGADMPADVAVVGFADPALANVGIEVANVTSMDAPVVVAADGAGGFVATVPAVAADDLRLTVIEDGVLGTLRGPPVVVAVGDAAVAPLAPGDPDATDAVLGFSASLVTIAADGTGNVTVTGGAGATTAAAEVVAGNVATGASATATAAPDGSFTLMIAGVSGDSLVLFARDAAGAASQTQVLTVP